MDANATVGDGTGGGAGTETGGGTGGGTAGGAWHREGRGGGAEAERRTPGLRSSRSTRLAQGACFWLVVAPQRR